MSEDKTARSEQVFLVDMDGTVADYEKAMLRDLAKLRHPLEPCLGDIDLYDDVPEWLEQRMRLIKQQPNWWLNLDPMPTNLWIVELAAEIGFTIHVLTKGPNHTPAAWSEKLGWCQKHLPNADVTITQNKGLVYGKCWWMITPNTWTNG